MHMYRLVGIASGNNECKIIGTSFYITGMFWNNLVYYFSSGNPFKLTEGFIVNIEIASGL